MIEVKDLVYIGVVAVGALAAIFSDRYQNRQNQKDIEELKKGTVSLDDYRQDLSRIKEVNTLQWSKLDEHAKWQASHEKEAWANRNDLELKIANLHGADEKLEAMLRSIEKKLDALIEKMEK